MPAYRWHKEDEDRLVKFYAEKKIPSDQLASNRTKRTDFWTEFCQKSGLTISTDELVRKVIALRKAGRLPRLVHSS